MRSFPFVFILFGFQLTFSQNYSGTIFDATTKLALPYVSIGVINQGVGTVAQSDGTFLINLPAELDDDTIRISMVGYQSILLPVKKFKAPYPSTNCNIFLEESVNELSDVIIRPKNTKTVTLGNQYDNPNSSAGFISDDLGSELGTVMKVKKGKTYFLKTAVFNIAKCNYDSILFRVNVYDFKNGRPGEILQSLPMYVKAVKNQRKIELDLTPYNITVDNDFLLSLEWIMDLPGKKTNFMFCAGFIGNRIFYRKTSQDRWSTVPICIGSYCVAEYGTDEE